MPATRTGMVIPNRGPVIPQFRPTDFRVFTGLEVPDIITFVVGEKWLGRPNLYPRQATLLKVIFLREDLFTDYDYEVVDEWTASFKTSGNNGISPDILERMRQLKEWDHRWFREVLLVLGRRAGKGYVSALAMAYVLWNYMAKGNPQEHYGIDREKQLACFIYAGKKEQATQNLWADLNNVIMASECFREYISKPLGESISLYAPNDFVRMKRLISQGIQPAKDIASFTIQPKEATLMSGRGPASFMQGYDEMAHQVAAGGAARSAEEVYGAATPALDQFKKDAFIIEPSSPWQMIGQFYANWLVAINTDPADEMYNPAIMMLQLASWEMYYDWQEAHLLPLFPTGYLGDLGEYVEQEHPRLPKLKLAIQEFDDGMRRLEKANPDTFAVERRAHWQATIDAYLDPNKVDAMFGEWKGELLTQKTQGLLSLFYKGHGDPSTANANFGVAIAHPETDDQGMLHCVFDYISFWNPADFPDHTLDYVYIEERLWELAWNFKTDEFTFDQHQSKSFIDRMNHRVRQTRPPKRMEIFEQTATVQHNFRRAENFKMALNQGWIHAPHLEQAELELKFLQLKNGKVEKQDSGPVQTKDVADCLFECVWTILGQQVREYTHGALSGLTPSGSQSGGFDPYLRERERPDTIQELAGLNRRFSSVATADRRAGRTSPQRSTLRGGGRARRR